MERERDTTRSDGTPVAQDAAAAADARRRSRRRGLRYGTVAVSIVAVAAAAALLGGPRLEHDDRGDAAPESAGSAVRVAGWAKFHVGWAYVFADGRVVSDAGGGPLVERWLSRYGLELLRIGQIDAQDLASDPGSVTDAAWSDRTSRNYRPTSYAICAVGPPGGDGRPMAASALAVLLPEAVRRHVAGTARMFRHGDYEKTAPAGGPEPVQSCFIVSPGQARRLWAYTEPHPEDDAGRDGVLNPGNLTFGILELTDGTEALLWAQPLLPDGSAGSWGG